MNLYEIKAEILRAMDEAVDLETGEITDTVAYAALDALEEAKEEKIENILLWVKNLNAEAAALKAEKQAYADRQSRAERKAESLKRYVEGALAGEKFKTTRVQVSWRKTTSCEVDDGAEWSLPDEYVKVTTSVDKTALTKALKAGQEFDCARLVQKQSMSIK